MNTSNEYQAPRDWQDDESGREALERQRLLGTRLRTLFSDVVSEDLPSDLSALLDKLPDRRVNGER
jgi:Anti-sigma factor NepR